MEHLDFPAAGDPLSAAWGRDVARHINGLNISGVHPVIVAQDINGVTISLARQDDGRNTVQHLPWICIALNQTGQDIKAGDCVSITQDPTDTTSQTGMPRMIAHSCLNPFVINNNATIPTPHAYAIALSDVTADHDSTFIFRLHGYCWAKVKLLNGATVDGDWKYSYAMPMPGTTTLIPVPFETNIAITQKEPYYRYEKETNENGEIEYKPILVEGYAWCLVFMPQKLIMPGAYCLTNCNSVELMLNDELTQCDVMLHNPVVVDQGRIYTYDEPISATFDLPWQNIYLKIKRAREPEGGGESQESTGDTQAPPELSIVAKPVDDDVGATPESPDDDEEEDDDAQLIPLIILHTAQEKYLYVAYAAGSPIYLGGENGGSMGDADCTGDTCVARSIQTLPDGSLSLYDFLTGEAEQISEDDLKKEIFLVRRNEDGIPTLRYATVEGETEPPDDDGGDCDPDMPGMGGAADDEDPPFPTGGDSDDPDFPGEGDNNNNSAGQNDPEFPGKTYPCW